MSPKSDLDGYRISSQVEVQAVLREMHDKHSIVTLSGPGGIHYTTMLWAVDPERGIVCFSAEPGDPQLERLLESDEVVAVAYMNEIKVQFDIDDVVQVRGATTALNARYPSEIYRFQRRGCFRVKPLMSGSPVAHFAHPGKPDVSLALRILDVSLTGVALSLPPDLPMVAAGASVPHCQLELDSDTTLDVGLVIQHVAVMNGNTQGARLGCELVRLDGHDERGLQHYINQTQKRRNALAP